MYSTVVSNNLVSNRYRIDPDYSNFVVYLYVMLRQKGDLVAIQWILSLVGPHSTALRTVTASQLAYVQCDWFTATPFYTLE